MSGTDEEQAFIERLEADDRWDSRELGASATHTKHVAPEHVEAMDEAAGLKMISIRLPVALIDSLKQLAAREGIGYQALVRRVLKDFVEPREASPYEQAWQQTTEARLARLERAAFASGASVEETPPPRSKGRRSR